MQAWRSVVGKELNALARQKNLDLVVRKFQECEFLSLKAGSASIMPWGSLTRSGGLQLREILAQFGNAHPEIFTHHAHGSLDQLVNETTNHLI